MQKFYIEKSEKERKSEKEDILREDFKNKRAK